MRESSYLQRLPDRFQEPGDISEIRSRREVFTAPETRFKHSPELHELVVETLMKDADAVDVVPVPGTGYDARVRYPERVKEGVFSLYQDWLRPSFEALEKAAQERVQDGRLSVRAAAEAHARIEESIAQALHAPLLDIRTPLEGSEADREVVSAENIRTSSQLLQVQVMALRSILRGQPDWLQRVDLAAQGAKRKRRIDTAWKLAMADEDWLPTLNRALGVAGASGDSLPESARAERHVSLSGQALIPERGEQDWFVDSVERANAEARREGVSLQAELKANKESHIEKVRALTRIEAALQGRIDSLNNEDDSFDLPDLLNWRAQIAHLSHRIIEQEIRAGSLEKMVDRWEIAGESEQARDAMRASHFALGEENGKLAQRLTKVREAYQRVGKDLDALAAAGVVFEAPRPVGLMGLYALVQARLREVAVPHPKRG